MAKGHGAYVTTRSTDREPYQQHEQQDESLDVVRIFFFDVMRNGKKSSDDSARQGAKIGDDASHVSGADHTSTVSSANPILQSHCNCGEVHRDIMRVVRFWSSDTRKEHQGTYACAQTCKAHP